MTTAPTTQTQITVAKRRRKAYLTALDYYGLSYHAETPLFGRTTTITAVGTAQQWHAFGQWCKVTRATVTRGITVKATS